MQSHFNKDRLSPSKQKLGYCLESLTKYRLESVRRLRAYTEAILREVVRVAEETQRSFEFNCAAFENEVRMAFNDPHSQVHSEQLSALLDLRLNLTPIDTAGLYSQAVVFDMQLFKRSSRVKGPDIASSELDEEEPALPLYKLVAGTPVVEVLDLQSQAKTRIQLQTSERFSIGCVVCSLHDGRLFISGGESKTSKISTPTAMVFSPHDFQLEAVTPMKAPRAFHSAVSLGQLVYVLGGVDFSGRKMTACECYDPNTDRWTSIADLSVSRSYHASCAYQGKIFVVGGWDARSIEAYNPSEDSFTLLPVKLSASGPCAVAMFTSSCLIFVGAEVERLFLNSMTISPITQLEVGQWWSQYPPVVSDKYVFVLRYHDEQVYSFDSELRQVTRIAY
jgi:hypothetical protein